MEMNTSEWKSFKISKLFDVYTGGDKPRKEIQEGILVNSIENQTTNNGIKEKIAFNGKKVFENFISIVSIGEGGKAFYQEEKGAIFTRVKALIPKFKLNKYIGLFLVPILNLEGVRYSYGRVLDADRLKDTEIKLPVDKEGNPDWDFMENYSKLIYNKEAYIMRDNSVINRKIELNTRNWKYFKIKVLFNVVGSKHIIKRNVEEYGYGKYPFVVTSAENNGVEGFYNYFTEEGNVLTIDSATVGTCFYQPLNFSASDHVEKLIDRYPKMNVYIGLFLATIINLEKKRYGYGRKFSQKRIKDTEIKLPVDKEGNPDWDFMENYIKSLPYSSNF
jgi:hypothetical protein